MTFPGYNEVITPQRWLWRPRVRKITAVQIHATRGNASPEVQYSATKGWMQSPNNRGAGGANWGGSCSFILGRDGLICKVLNDNQECTYSAGYGGADSEWAIDELGPSVEWCQSANLEEYTTVQYERGAEIYAYYSRVYGIPPVIIDVPSQRGPVPTGYIRHDGCENGTKLGKTDPGYRFRNADFLSLVREKLQGEDDMKPEDIDARITQLLNAARTITDRFVRADGQDEVYEIINGRRVWLVSGAVAVARGMAPDMSNVRVVNAVQLLAWPEGQL